jgi:hypothetical protein
MPKARKQKEDKHRRDRVLCCSCGSRSFIIRTPVRGVWREYVTFDEAGCVDPYHSESTTDDLVLGGAPKTMRCAECRKRHPNAK